MNFSEQFKWTKNDFYCALVPFSKTKTFGKI